VKVLYDDEIFSTQTTGGISRYFVELISHLDRLPNVSISLPVMLTANEYIRHSNLFHGIVVPKHYKFKGRRMLFRAVNRMNLIRAALYSDFDVFHFTYYDVTLLRYLKDKAFVITIHDLTPELFSGSTSTVENERSGLIRLFPLQSFKRQLIERAAPLLPFRCIPRTTWFGFTPLPLTRLT
jgi:hypothetical protein